MGGAGRGELWNCTTNQRSPRFCRTALMRRGAPSVVLPSSTRSVCYEPDISTMFSVSAMVVALKGMALTTAGPDRAVVKYYSTPSGAVTNSGESVP